MRRTVLDGLALLTSFVVVCTAYAAESPASAMLAGVYHFQGDDIRFRSHDGKIVFVDPITPPTDPAVVKTGMLKPDVILITHPHDDHFVPDLIKKYLAENDKAILVGPEDVVKTAKAAGIANVLAVRPKQSHEVSGIKLRTVPAYFAQGGGHPRENNWVGYVLALNGHRYYVTGDTEMVPEIAEVRADVVFPLIMGCGGNIANAVQMAAAVKPRLAVPVHAGEREEVMQRYIAKLPGGIEGRYYLHGELQPVK